jgi:hypothetical protein
MQMTSNMKPNLCFLLVLGAGTLLLSACRVVVETEIRQDGSGELRTAIVFSEEENQGFAETPGNEGKSICESVTEDAPAGADLSEEVRDGETWCITTQTFADLAQLRQLYSGMGTVTVRELRLDEADLVVNLEIDLTDSSDEEQVATEWRLRLPGTLGDHNAHRVEAGVLVWDVNPGERQELRAKSTVGSGVPIAAIVGAGILLLLCALVLAAGVVIFFVLRRRQAGPAA